MMLNVVRQSRAPRAAARVYRFTGRDYRRTSEFFGEMDEIPRFGVRSAPRGSFGAVDASSRAFSALSPTWRIGSNVISAVAPWEVVYAVEAIDRIWYRREQSAVGYAKCAAPTCGIGDEVRYYAGSSCVPLGPCPAGQALPPSEGIREGPQVAWKVLQTGPNSFTIGEQWLKPAGVTNPIVLPATLPLSPLEIPLVETPMVPSPGRLPVAKPGSDLAIRVGPLGRTIDFVDKGNVLEIRQPPPAGGSARGLRGKPERLRVDTAPHWLARVRNRRGGESKTRLQKGVARAIKLYHTFTEVTDANDAIFAALPREIREASGKRSFEKAQTIWANLDQIDIPLAIYSLIYNHYEDKVVGRTSAQIQKVTGRSGKALFHGPAGLQFSQFGRQLGQDPGLQGLAETASEAFGGPDLPSVSKALPHYSVGEARTRLMSNF